MESRGHGNSESPNVLADGTGAARTDSSRTEPTFDADIQGQTPRDPHPARLGHLRVAGGRRDPRVRGAWLDAGPCRPACPRARLSHRASGCARRRLFGRGRCRGSRRPGFGRRHVPGVPARLSAAARSGGCLRSECSSLESPSGRSDTGSGPWRSSIRGGRAWRSRS